MGCDLGPDQLAATVCRTRGNVKRNQSNEKAERWKLERRKKRKGGRESKKCSEARPPVVWVCSWRGSAPSREARVRAASALHADGGRPGETERERRLRT